MKMQRKRSADRLGLRGSPAARTTVQLYLADSALVELIRTGVLVGPAPKLIDLLPISVRYAELTGGAGPCGRSIPIIFRRLAPIRAAHPTAMPAQRWRKSDTGG